VAEPLTLAVIGLLLIAGTPATAQTVNYHPLPWRFRRGTYSVPRDAAVGSQVARAMSPHRLGITCALIQTATVQWHGNLGREWCVSDQREWYRVSFYVVNGGSQTLITSTGGYTSGTISAPAAARSRHAANLIVTGRWYPATRSRASQCDRDIHSHGRCS